MDKTALLLEAARRSLITFCELINPGWETTWFHEHLAERLQRALERARRGEKVRIILSVPPRSGKSQLASIYFPAWALGNHPDTRFILSTYGMELSELNGRKTRDVIASEAYQAMFPNVTLREDQKAKAKWVVRDSVSNAQTGAREGSYTSVGIGSAVTGVGGDCLVAGTKVSVGLHTTKPIEAIKVGDTVLGYNVYTKEMALKKVEAVRAIPTTKDIVTITMQDGKEISATEDHFIFVWNSNGYRPAGDFSVGDAIFDNDNFVSSVVRRRPEEGELVYDIQVADVHNFFAEGILVHNCIIIDDPHKDRAEAESETISNAVWEYYRSTLYSRLEGAGAIIVIMQRWNDKDLVGRLLAEQQAKASSNEPHDEWEVIQFPAIAEQDEYIDGKLMRQAGEALWPSKFPIATLENIKSVQGAYFFQSQYQQNPIGKDTQEFSPADFQYYEPSELRGKYLRYYTLVDPAISQKKEADNTVVLTIAKEVAGPNWYRVREDAGHFTPAQTVDLIFSHQSDFHSEVHVEMVQYQAALKYAIIEEQRRRQQYFTLKELKARGDKKTRIRGLVPLYRARVIWHLRSDTAYEHELLTFPNGRRDDRADAMAYALSVMDNTSTGTKQVRSKFKGYFAKRGL